ncbi:MAG: sorbosone dehydrogenase family protein, partial [Methyloceanibacter sp.]
MSLAPARGWPDGSAPVPAAGFSVGAFASGLDHPRWLYVLPNGDVLVAETNTPPSDAPRDFMGVAMAVVMSIVGAGGDSPNRITLLRDADGDG